MRNRNGNPLPHLRDLPVFLRAPRAGGLWLVGVLIAVASVVAFGLSYRGLFLWAAHHQWPQPWPAFFPLLIDVLIVVCEVILFVAAIDGDTPWHVRALAWVTLLAFTSLSVIGNAEHALRASWQDRGGFALPPLVLAVALGFGLGELKRQAAKYRNAGTEDVAGEILTSGPGSSPATTPGTVPSPPFTDAQTAALAALERTTAAGNALSQNQLMTQFRLSRAEARDVRQKVALREENGNGQGQGLDGDPGWQGPRRQAHQDSGRRGDRWQGRQGQVTPERSRGAAAPDLAAPAAHVPPAGWHSPAGASVPAGDRPPAPAGTYNNGQAHG